MTFDSKKMLLPIALVAALLGGTAGAFVTRSSKTQAAAPPADTTATTTTPPVPAQTATNPANAAAIEQTPLANSEQAKLDASDVADDQMAYRDGFTEGFRAAREERDAQTATRSSAATRRYAEPTRVVYRNTARSTRASRADGARRVYYDYEQPRKRSFWSKHRDKLTVAAGAGGGAIIGGLIGGKKGAAIGALAGGGGSALYTYKIRKKDRRY